MPINLSTPPAVYHWRPAAWLAVGGADAAEFLQGQFTNDLRALERVPAVYGLWLTVKGKVLADSFVLRRKDGDGFWIGSYFSAAATILERLESHIIADDVTIEDVTARWEGCTVFGDSLSATLPASPPPEVLIFPARRTTEPAVECVSPVGGLTKSTLAGLEAVELTAGEINRRRIEAGIPRVPTDLGPGDLPNEAGLEADAISYTKGCYLGQEVMARLKSMGQVRRRLWRVRGNGDVPALPAPVFAAARQVGELRSAEPDGQTGWIGLAMVSLLHAGPDAELAFAPDAAPSLRLNSTP